MLKVIIDAYNTVRNNNKRNISLLDKIYQALFANKNKLENINKYSYIQSLNQAIEQLEHQNREINLAVFDDLATMAQGDPKLHRKIMAALTNFIRNNAAQETHIQVQDNPLSTIRADIQAALSILANRNTQQDREIEQLDLSHIDIRGAKLSGANFEMTNLYQTNLSGADLCSANLHGAILTAANLSGANLAGANLKEAILSAANLSGANLSGANLNQANLYLAKLDGVILKDTILNGANLREAKFSDVDISSK
ncbi:pentapeptide repeat-containing protein [Calothrix sp. FACHB-1219]|uniref:pentapeptide repeat-containing protein n=1 Tax=unclassified Calothrix TaxID=2619626 RepID=UPI001689E6B6|nr:MULTISPECIES: pentapeptide repeat-containing protein [unclassified Calothrix]MBD2202921.1 pentapeptide repeat-containing protein [Calothrix sp. FACHB-168]MBD2216049.1 pentapeptide repeat-containing protein [Calothrix sp. FACHB-1219]